MKTYNIKLKYDLISFPCLYINIITKMIDQLEKSRKKKP